MSLGLVGRKVGMTRVFTDDGDSIPVTVVDVSNNRVTQIKTPRADGYCSVQVAYGKRRARRVNKAAAGHFAKAGVEAGSVLKEFRVTPGQIANLKVGGVIGVDVFAVGQKVDVAGTTIGKGSRRDKSNFSSNRASHDLGIAQQASRSDGSRAGVSRRKMTGHLGDVKRTTRIW